MVQNYKSDDSLSDENSEAGKGKLAILIILYIYIF
jgi:hypothetical protein